MKNTAALTLSHVTKSFGGVEAVSDLSCEIQPGETIGVIGPNGAGKSTLLALLSGILRPDKGEILLRGKTITRLPVHAIARLGVTRTFQDARLIPQAPISEYLELVAPFRRRPGLLSALFGSKRLRSDRISFASRAKQHLAEINLEETVSHYGTDVSYGQSKLIELCRVKLATAEVLLLDEPFSGLSPAMVGTMTGLIRDLAAEGKTILLVEHNLRLIEDLSDRVLVLAAGKRLDFGTYDDVSKNPLVIDAYLGH